MHPDEVTVQEMKRALDDPQSGIQVIDVEKKTNGASPGGRNHSIASESVG